MACSPCILDSVLRLPSADNELLSMGVSALSPQHRAPHAAAQVQPSSEQQTPDMALLDFAISEEEMEWLVALSHGDATSSVGSGTPAAGPVVAAEAALASTIVTAPMPQQEVQQMHPSDLMVPCTSFTGLTASQADAAAGAAAECDNNCAWVADVAASPVGESTNLRLSRAIKVFQGVQVSDTLARLPVCKFCRFGSAISRGSGAAARAAALERRNTVR